MFYNKKDKIGPYTVVFPHKQGAYAETYRVKDSKGKNCFLKLINHSKLNRNQIDENGQIIEVEIAKHLVHPNLCKYVDSENLMLHGGQFTYLVTEYVSGETLSQKIVRDGELGIYEIKQVATHVLTALQYLHLLPYPVVHGDVTIQNVLVSFSNGWNDLKLIDLGHARYLNQEPAKLDLDSLNVFCLAPECFSGVVQVQSDLYAALWQVALVYRLVTYG